MIDLIQLKHYLRARGIVPLQDISVHFKVDHAAVRPLLSVWMDKGKVRKFEGGGAACRGCCKCDPAILETYQWLE